MFLNNCETVVLGATHSSPQIYQCPRTPMHLVEVIEAPGERDSEMLTLECIVGTAINELP